MGHYDEHLIELNCDCPICQNMKIKQSSVYIPNTWTISSNFENIEKEEKEENEPIKEVSQELEYDGEDGCYIDYFTIQNEMYGLLNPDISVIKTETCFGTQTEESKQLADSLKSKIRQFETGATRDTSEGKLEFARFMSPIVIKRYAEYMDLHRKQSDGNLRDPDNWMHLFGDNHEDVCMDSLWRHLMDAWLINKGFKNEAREDLESALCAILFNTQAWLFKLLKEKQIENK